MPLGLFGSIFSSALGASSQDSANHTNLRINHMNNAFNERMLEKQYQYSKEQFAREKALEQSQWERDTKYNSASAQAERFRQAGLNPTIMMKGQSAGMAQSGSVGGQSVGLPSSSGNATMQGFTPNIDGRGVFGSILGFLNYKQSKEQNDLINEGIRIENQYKAQKIMAEVADLKSRALTNKAKAKLDNTIESLQNNIMRNANRQTDALIQRMNEESQLIKADRLLKSKELDIFDERFRQEAAIRLAQVQNYIEASGLSAAQAKHEYQKELKTMAEQGLFKKQTDRASEPSLVEKGQRIADGLVNLFNDASYKLQNKVNKMEKKFQSHVYRYTGIKL